MRYIFYKPVNGIIGITSLVEILSFLVWIKRTNIYKFAFTHPPSPYVLQHDNISFAHVILEMTGPVRPEIIFSIWCTAIRCPSHEDGMLFGGIFWDIDGREQFYTVAHWNVPLDLIIVVADPG